MIFHKDFISTAERSGAGFFWKGLEDQQGGEAGDEYLGGGNCQVEVGTSPQYCSWITFSTRYVEAGREGGEGD